MLMVVRRYSNSMCLKAHQNLIVPFCKVCDPKQEDVFSLVYIVSFPQVRRDTVKSLV